MLFIIYSKVKTPQFIATTLVSIIFFSIFFFLQNAKILKLCIKKLSQKFMQVKSCVLSKSCKDSA